MSLRQALWILVLLLLLLAGWQFLRAVWLSRDPMSQLEASAASSAPGATSRQQVPATSADAAAGEDDGSEALDYAPEPRPGADVAEAAAGSGADAFRATLETQCVRRLLEGQQALVEQQRAEIEMLQTELAGLRQQVEETLHAQLPQSATSPEYAEARRLAEQGLGADEIAARCGISIAEAGLLLALARNGERQ